MTRWLVAVLLMLVGGLVYGEVRAARARAAERAVSLEAHLRLKMALAESLEAERQAADSAARARDSVNVRQLLSYSGKAARATRRADSLLRLLPDTALAETIRAEYDIVIQVLHAALHVSETRAALFYARWQAADSAVARERALRDSWRQQADAYRRQQPSTIEKIVTVASCGTTGFAAAERRALVAGVSLLVCLVSGT